MLFSIILSIFTTTSAQNKTKQLLFQNSPSGAFLYGYSTTAVTTNGSAMNADTITLGSDEAGVLQVTVVGFNKDSASAVTGAKILRYVKSGGTLTLGSATADLAVAADTKLGSATFAVASVGNNAVVQVTGTSGVTVQWKIFIRRTYIRL